MQPTLIVIGYENEIKAEEVRLALLKLQREYLIDLGDAVVAVREPDGGVKLRQLVNTSTYNNSSVPRWSRTTICVSPARASTQRARISGSRVPISFRSSRPASI